MPSTLASEQASLLSQGVQASLLSQGVQASLLSQGVQACLDQRSDQGLRVRSCCAIATCRRSPCSSADDLGGDFAQMWVGSRLKQWPNHFSLLFSRKVSTGFTGASFLMSSFLRWSNPVFPLVHLSILISTEFSLFSSFFFTAQHSEPYVAAFLSLHNNLYVHISCQKNIGIVLQQSDEPCVGVYPMFF